MASYAVLALLLFWTAHSSRASWSSPTGDQYHIQTDEGNQRFFRYKTLSGQYRKEKRLEDGTVVGAYAWIDADGILHQRDYIADSQGYRILKSRTVYVGRETPIEEAIKAAKKVPPSTGTLVKPLTRARPAISGSYPSHYARPKNSSLAGPATYPEIYDNALTFSTPQPPPTPAVEPSYHQWPLSSAPQVDHHSTGGGEVPYNFRNGPTYPIDTQGHLYTGNGYDTSYNYYDGVAVTNNGYRYYIPRAYHEEQTHDFGTRKTGSFGYIDPFGIRRVVYYDASPQGGFKHRKNNRYVGFKATPYDPPPYK